MKSSTTIKSALIASLMTLTFICASPSAQAQAPSVSLKPHIYLGGGIATVANPTLFKDMLDQSFSLMAAIGLPLNTGFEIIPKLHYHKFNITQDFLLSAGLTAKNPKMEILTIGADLKMGLLPGPVPTKPYLLIGGGTANLSQDAISGLPSVDATKFYMNIGGGVDIKVGLSFAFFVEGKYTFVSSSGANLGIFPLMAGIRVM